MSANDNKPVNDPEYIGFSEAASRTGKSEMTIRRLVKKPAAKQHIKTENGVTLISAEFVKTIYPLDYKHVNAVNLNDNFNDNAVNRSENKPVNSDNSMAAVLQVKLEENERLIASLQQQVDRAEKQYEEYRQDKEKELERVHKQFEKQVEQTEKLTDQLHELGSNAQKLQAQQAQLLSLKAPGSNEQQQDATHPAEVDKSDSIKKKRRWFGW